MAWLERQGEAANSARLTQQALSLARQAAAQTTGPRGGSCGKTGHKTENCTRGEGRGKHLDQGLAGNAFAASGKSQPNQRLRAPLGGEPGQQDGSRSPDHIPRQEWAQKLLTEEGSKEIRGTAEARRGPCPVCRDKHIYHRKLAWGSISWPSSRLQDCGTFRALSPPQRARMIEERGPWAAS